MKNILTVIYFLLMLYACGNTKVDQNPFFSEFDTPNGVPPFNVIKNEHFVPAFKEAMKRHDLEIDSIVNNPDKPTFENTVAALDNAGQMLKRVSAVFDGLRGTMNDSILQKIASNLSPRLTEHSDNINLNKKLFNRIKLVYDDSVNSNLDTEQKKVLEKYYRSFVRSGILLDGSQQNRLREINKELGVLSLKFGENLLAETDNFMLVIDNRNDLSGLPADIVAMAAKTADKKGKPGKWVFTLSKSSWEPFVQYADNRSLREKIYKAMYSRCNNNDQYDNKNIIREIATLRLEKANILGYATYADYVLENTMAKSADAVLKMLNDIWAFALPQAKEEAKELQALITKDGNDFKLEPWDWWYYAEKLRKMKFALEDEEIKPYFEAENVRDGIFAVAKKLYGVNFKIRNDIPVYNKDVKTFEVTDADGSFIGIFYTDYYARPGQKRNGAWMSSFRKQQILDGDFIHPNIFNVCNFTPPNDSIPSLLTLDQVETMFHEFGHGLHGLFSKCNYNAVSGTAVVRDFVELPSQIMEHWAFEPEVLKMYAKHYKTGKIIPDALIKKIKNASSFNQGFLTTELVAAAYLDMDWHMLTANQADMLTHSEKRKGLDVERFENDAMNKIGLIEEIIPRYKSTYFAHIFDGGYSSGYYSYLWSEVLDSDAFQAFTENGIFDQETARSFRENILSKGGSDDPMVLYKKFRGNEPNPIFLLKNRGFVK